MSKRLVFGLVLSILFLSKYFIESALIDNKFNINEIESDIISNKTSNCFFFLKQNVD